MYHQVPPSTIASIRVQDRVLVDESKVIPLSTYGVWGTPLLSLGMIGKYQVPLSGIPEFMNKRSAVNPVNAEGEVQDGAAFVPFDRSIFPLVPVSDSTESPVPSLNTIPPEMPVEDRFLLVPPYANPMTDAFQTPFVSVPTLSRLDPLITEQR